MDRTASAVRAVCFILPETGGNPFAVGRSVSYTHLDVYKRQDYYNKDSENKNIAEIIIAKQRNGPIGTVNLVWLPNYTKFVNMKK